MDKTTLVGRLNGRVNQLVAEAIARGVDIRAFGWAQTAEYGSPHLYLVCPLADEGRSHEVRAVLQSILRSSGKVWLLLSDTRIVGPSHPLARGLLSIAARIPDDDPTPITHTAPELGSVEIFGPAYIYPLPKPAPTTATATGS